MGKGVTYGDPKSHLFSEYKKAGGTEGFLEKIVPILEEITGTSLTVTVNEEETTESEFLPSELACLGDSFETRLFLYMCPF